jgi:hypothetical protein
MTDEERESLLKNLNNPDSWAAEFAKSLPRAGYRLAEDTVASVPEVFNLAGKGVQHLLDRYAPASLIGRRSKIRPQCAS